MNFGEKTCHFHFYILERSFDKMIKNLKNSSGRYAKTFFSTRKGQ